MGKVDRFEDLHCWQAARELTKLVYEACEMGKLVRDFETGAQIKGAARFLNISQTSSMEVKSISYALEDSRYLPDEWILRIRESSEKAKGLTLGLMKYLRRKR